MFALGLLSWLYARPVDGTEAFLQQPVRQGARHPRRQRRGVQGRLELRRDDRDVRRLVRDQAGADAARHLPQHHRQPGARLRPGRRRPVAGCRCSSAPTRSPRPRDILHELSKHKAFGVTTFQAEDEIAGIGAALGASFAGALGVTTTSGPGIALKSRDDRPGGDDRAAAASSSTSSAAARRPACRPRPSRPTCCRRCSAATARRRSRSSRRSSPGDCFDAALEAARIAVTYRTPGHAALRRLPGQRLRAVADPRGRRPARHRPRLRHRGQPRDARPATAGVLALPARRGDPRPPVGDPGHARPRAPHRRPREGRRARQHLLRPGQPRLHGPDPAGQGRPDRRLAPAARGRRPDAARRDVLVLGWGSTYGPIGAGCPPRAQGRARSRPGPPAPPQPVPTEPRRGPRALRRGAGPRDEPRPARAADPGPLPRRRVGYNQVRGLPFEAAELAEAIHRGDSTTGGDPPSDD